MPMNARIAIDVGCRHDVPELVELARVQLPSMSYLHDPETWSDYYRFGAGSHPRDNYFLVARAANSDDTGQLLGFIWVDPSMSIDHGIDQPWWCINAVAVPADVQRRGLGRHLVSMVRARADQVGVVSIYGVSHPSGFGFWKAQDGFVLAADDAALVSSEPVLVGDSELPQTITLAPEPGHRFFYATCQDRPADSIILQGDDRLTDVTQGS